MICYIEIVERATGNIEESLGPMSEVEAEQVKRGTSINLNRVDYYVRTIYEKGD